MSQNPLSVYPVIKLGGKEYPIKFNMGTIWRLKALKIDPNVVAVKFKELAEKPDLAMMDLPIEELCGVISAVISNAELKVSPEQVADLLEPATINETLESIQAGFTQAAGRAAN